MVLIKEKKRWFLHRDAYISRNNTEHVMKESFH